MKAKFVLIFREGRKLSEQELKDRTEAVRNWALQHVRTHSLEPRILADESYQLGDGAANHGRQVTALNFIEADDLKQAVKIAETHPALDYGVAIEVRPWRDPRAAAA